MKRAWVVVGAMLAAVWLCLVPSKSWSGRAEAADDLLTAGAKEKLDASLLVFAGEVEKVGPAPKEEAGGFQSVTYRVALVVAGRCEETRLVVEHAVKDHGDPSSPGLDPALFAVGNPLIVGIQLRAQRDARTYTLRNTAREYGPVMATEPLLRSVIQYVNPALPARMAATERLTSCMNNLSQLGQTYLMQSAENRAKAQKFSGPALWLAYRKNASEIRRGDERVLLCPADPKAVFPESPADWKRFDDVDLSNPAAGLCSYAGRDFVRCPLPESKEPQPIGACLHHPGGAVIAYDDGSVKFVKLKDLGLASDAEKIIGPDSKSPVLRVLR
jgi:hypothetical protein